LAAGFVRLQGVFIKAGQVLSVLGSFLPKGYAEAFEALQDRVPPRSFRQIKRRLESALGQDALTSFQSFEERALASASLAQVHRATTKEGQAVVVKLLYPGIEVVVQRDLGIFRRIHPVLRWLFPVQQSKRIVDQLEAMLTRELDYENERQNMLHLRSTLGNRADVVIPTPVVALCGPGVLTMTLEEGIKITATEHLRQAGVDPVQVARTLVECYFEMLLEHRVFHADPHPGNFLVRPSADGAKLVILDFGAVETVTPDLAQGMRAVALGGVTRSADKVLEGLVQMGFVAPDGDTEKIKALGRDYLALLSKVNIKSYAELDKDTLTKLSGFEQLRGRLRATMKHLQYPEGYFYVERTLALLFGLTAQLAPEKGLPGLAAPLALRALARGSVRRAPGTSRS
jgi:ubiquinone biosynthesis protein